MFSLKISIGIIGMILAAAATLEAKMVRYVDEHGRPHYVNTDVGQVPERYRSQLEPPKEEPKTVEPKSTDSTLLQPPPMADISAKSGHYDKVVLLVSPNCPNCARIQNFLNANNVAYTYYNAETDPIVKERYPEIGGTEMPVTILGDKIIKGYKLKEIYDILVRDKKISPK